MKKQTVAIQTSTEPTEVLGPQPHPLFLKDVRPYESWKNWREAWDGASGKGQLISLLHDGFSVSLRYSADSNADWLDLLRFYFSVADGWADYDLLDAGPEDRQREYEDGVDKVGNRITKRPSQLRQDIAVKAFQMLCAHFFKSQDLYLPGARDQRDYLVSWERLIATPEIFPLITRFFRTEKAKYGDGVGIRNLRGREAKAHHEEHAIEFLRQLAVFMWTWKQARIDCAWETTELTQPMKEMRDRLDAAQPWMVEVLSYTGSLDILEKWSLDLSEKCLEKLRQIAMRAVLSKHQHPVIEDRPVASVEEAYFVGSASAEFLMHRESRKNVHSRLQEVLEAEEELRSAKRKVQELSLVN